MEYEITDQSEALFSAIANGDETALRDAKLELASIFMFLSGTDQQDHQAFAEFCSEAEGFLEDWLNNRD